MKARVCIFCGGEFYAKRGGRRKYCYNPECVAKQKELNKAYNREWQHTHLAHRREYQAKYNKNDDPFIDTYPKRTCRKCKKEYQHPNYYFCPECANKMPDDVHYLTYGDWHDLEDLFEEI